MMCDRKNKPTFIKESGPFSSVKSSLPIPGKRDSFCGPEREGSDVSKYLIRENKPTLCSKGVDFFWNRRVPKGNMKQEIHKRTHRWNGERCSERCESAKTKPLSRGKSLISRLVISDRSG